MKKLFAVLLILIGAIFVMGQEKRQLPIPQSNITTIFFSDFGGGLNLVDHPAHIADNELLSAQNLIYQGNNLIGRPGFKVYPDSAFSPYANRNVKGLVRQILRNGTKKIYVAIGDSLWGSNTTETNFTALTGGTIDSTQYVEFQNWNDTVYFVDGSKFWKIVGTTIVEATTCDSGKISALPEVVSALSDTLLFSKTRGNLSYNPVANGFVHMDLQFDIWIGKGRNAPDTARALIFPDLLSNLQSGDSIVSCSLSLRVLGEFSGNDETLAVRRNSTLYNTNTVNWANKPLTAGNAYDSIAIATTGVTVKLNLRLWADSVVNRGLPNNGLQFYIRDESNTNTAKRFQMFNTKDPGNDALLQILRVPKNLVSTLKPAQIIDTTKLGIWIDNEWSGYFVEFPQLDDTNRFRLITANKGDTLFLVPRLTTSNLVGNSYRIVARPSSIEKVYPTGANPNKIDTVTIHSFADSLRYVYIGNQPDLANGTLNANTYFLKIISGKGVGDYQILKNYSTTTDFVLVFNGKTDFLDTTSRFEIYRRVFPSPEHFTVNKSRFWFADTLHLGRLWFSEPNRPAQVGALNFHTVGGDPSEGEITYLGGLYVSNYADPQNPLVIGRENAIYLEFNDNPRLDYPRKIVSNTGISSARSVVPYAGFLYHNHRSKLYRFDGRNDEWISQKLGAPFDDSLGAYVSCFLHNQMIYCNVPKSNKSYSYDLIRGVWTGDHSLGWTVATGQQSVRDTVPVLISAFEKAKVRYFGRNGLDGDNAIASKFQTKYYNLGKPEVMKVLREFVIDYSTKVPTYQGYATGFGSPALLDVIFFSKEHLLDIPSTDSVRILSETNGDKSFKRFLTGKSFGRNFSFMVKSDNNSGYRVGQVSIGMELYPMWGGGL